MPGFCLAGEPRGKYSQSANSVGLGRRFCVISSAWLCWIVVMIANMLWLCWSAIWIALSSVILVGPLLWQNAEPINAHASTEGTINPAPNFRSNAKLFKGGLRYRKLIAISRDPDIKRR